MAAAIGGFDWGGLFGSIFGARARIWRGVVMVLVQVLERGGWVSSGSISLESSGKTDLLHDGRPLDISRPAEGFVVLAKAVEMGLSLPPERMIASDAS